MTDTPEYTPPEVWVWEKDDSPKWRYSNVNRPIAGATHEKELARGKHPLQLYSLATPNGVKVTIMLEELLAAGHSGAEYDAWLIRIGEGDQFGSGFVGVNPNSKIPALMDYSEQTPRRVFESGAILLYLADKFGAFLPTDRGKRIHIAIAPLGTVVLLADPDFPHSVVVSVMLGSRLSLDRLAEMDRMAKRGLSNHRCGRCPCYTAAFTERNLPPPFMLAPASQGDRIGSSLHLGSGQRGRHADVAVGATRSSAICAMNGLPPGAGDVEV